MFCFFSKIEKFRFFVFLACLNQTHLPIISAHYHDLAVSNVKHSRKTPFLADLPGARSPSPSLKTGHRDFSDPCVSLWKIFPLPRVILPTFLTERWPCSCIRSRPKKGRTASTPIYSLRTVELTIRFFVDHFLTFPGCFSNAHHTLVHFFVLRASTFVSFVFFLSYHSSP